MSGDAKPVQWHIERLEMFERGILRRLSDCGDGRPVAAGPYRAQLEEALASGRRHLATLRAEAAAEHTHTRKAAVR